MRKTIFTGIIIAFAHVLMTAQDRSLYVSDAANFTTGPWKIFKFDEDGTDGEVFIDDHLAWPQDILFLEGTSEVLISNLNSGNISRFHAETGEYIDEFATGIGGPTRMKIGSDGFIYVLQWAGNGKVWRYRTDGSFVDEFTSTGVPRSIGLDWDNAGNLYVSSYSNQYVRKFSSSGQDMGLVVSSDLAGPTNIWIGDNGDVYVVDYNGATVKRFNSDGVLQGVFISDLPQGEGVDFKLNGNIVIGCGGTSSVREYTPEGTFVKTLIPSGTLGLKTPNAVVFRADPTSAVASLPAMREMTLVTPSVGHIFHLESDLPALEDPEIQVTDMQGRIVDSFRTDGSTTWTPAGLAAGTYYLIAQTRDGANARQTIVIQR